MSRSMTEVLDEAERLVGTVAGEAGTVAEDLVEGTTNVARRIGPARLLAIVVATVVVVAVLRRLSRSDDSSHHEAHHDQSEGSSGEAVADPAPDTAMALRKGTG